MSLRRGLRHRCLIALAICASIGVAGCSSDSPDGSAASTTTAAPSPGSVELASMPLRGDVEAGTYRVPRSGWSVAGYSITMPAGWTVRDGNVFFKNEDSAEEARLSPVVLEEIFDDACLGDGGATAVGPGVDDLVDALVDQPGPDVGDPVETTFGGHPAVRVDLTTPPDLDLETCRLFESGVHGLQIWFADSVDDYLVLLPDGTVSVYVVDVDGARQVFVTQHREATTDTDRAELRSIVDSIRIG